MKGFTFALIAQLFLPLLLCVAAIDALESVFFVNNLRFGQDKYGNGWFDFVDENKQIVAFSGLEEQRHAQFNAAEFTFSAQNTNTGVNKIPSKTFSKVIKLHQKQTVIAVTMIIHSDNRVSVSASGVYDDDGNSIKKPFHISPWNHLDRKTRDSVIRKQLRNLDAEESGPHHVLVYTPESPWGDYGECGAFGIDGEIERDANPEKVQKIGEIKVENYHAKPNVEKLNGHRHVNTEEFSNDISKTDARRLKADRLHVRSLRAEKWDNCYNGQEIPKIVEIGIIVDLGFYRSYDSDITLVEEAVDVIIAFTNLLYHFQFNLILRVNQIIVNTGAIPQGNCPIESSNLMNTLLNQDPAAGTCCIDIESALNGITELSARMTPKPLNEIPKRVQTFDEIGGDIDNLYKLAHWHLLSDCYPVDCGNDQCVVGLAWVYSGKDNAICRFDGSNVAISSRSFQTWLTFAHEFGHNIGAFHSFEEGEGTTGGIMDYGDGKYNSQYQFNRKYRFDEICGRVDTLITSERCKFENENGVEINLIPEYSGNCTAVNASDGELCPAGICFEGTCVPLETQLRIIKSYQIPVRFEYELIEFNSVNFGDFRLEPAEFSPFPPTKDAVNGSLILSKPQNGCSPLRTHSYVGKVVLIKRGTCTFLEKSRHALTAGAIAVVIYNDEYGPLKAMGGEGGFDIPVVAISRSDGEAIISAVGSPGITTAVIGGFPASEKLYPPVLNKKNDLWEEYYLFFMIFLPGSIGLSCIYLTMKYRKKLFQHLKLKKSNPGTVVALKTDP